MTVDLKQIMHSGDYLRRSGSELVGDPGPKGAFVVKGTLSGAATPLPSSPEPGDLWLVGTPVPTAVPPRAGGGAAQAGDAIVWDGSQWVNTGPVQGAGVPTGGSLGQQLVKTGSGDYATAWQAKPVYDVRDYGAVGDNNGDDTAAIQAAIDACAPKGGVVFIPSGNFPIYAPLIVPACVGLQGVGAVWGTQAGSTRPASILKCMTATAKVIVDGSGGICSDFSIDGMNVADGPLLHRRQLGAKRLFESIYLTKSKVEAWRIDLCQNDVWVDMHIYEHAGAGLVLDQGAGGNVFLGCEFAHCSGWHLIVTETTGTGPYVQGPSDNTFDHCLFELPKAPDTSIPGCIWIKTGKRTMFKNCSSNPVATCTVGQMKIDGSAMGADPIVVIDSFWFASAAAGNTAIVQDAGALYLDGAIEFQSYLNAWRFNGGTANVTGSIFYNAVTNRWDPAGTGDFRGNVIMTSARPAQVRTESNDFYAFRTSVYGDTGSRFDIGPTGVLAFGSGTGATDATITRASANRLHMSGVWRVSAALEAATYIDFTAEQASDPAAPAANGARIFTKDNGAGKTQLCVRFNTGAVQVIATEP